MATSRTLKLSRDNPRLVKHNENTQNIKQQLNMKDTPVSETPNWLAVHDVALNFSLKDVIEQLKVISSVISAFDSRLKLIENATTTLTTKVENIDTKLNLHIVAYDKLVSTISKLDDKITQTTESLIKQIDSITSRINAQDTIIITVDNKLKNVTSKVSDLELETTQLHNKITINSHDIESNKNLINTIQLDLTRIRSDLDFLYNKHEKDLESIHKTTSLLTQWSNVFLRTTSSTTKFLKDDLKWFLDTYIRYVPRFNRKDEPTSNSADRIVFGDPANWPSNHGMYYQYPAVPRFTADQTLMDYAVGTIMLPAIDTIIPPDLPSDHETSLQQLE